MRGPAKDAAGERRGDGPMLDAQTLPRTSHRELPSWPDEARASMMNTQTFNFR